MKNEQVKSFEYVIHTAVGKFVGYAPCRLAEPFGSEPVSTAYHLMEFPGDTRPNIFIRGDAVIAVECRELTMMPIKLAGKDGERVAQV
ncbi:hypothetical protein HV271_12165 [Citrobacter freundii]|uniref:hypothetical protein n=1 Tax=Citrobacter freundii TaxID=546 RepID=UPI0015EA39F2|nr:hypothetical protein [Citrobacter freundii]QLX25513.1 hypothetical protein HV271_12165 [Citrobacter freundii]